MKTKYWCKECGCECESDSGGPCGLCGTAPARVTAADLEILEGIAETRKFRTGSKDVMKALISAAVAKICFARRLFPDDFFTIINDGTLDVERIPVLLAKNKDSDSATLLDWVKKGVYDLIDRKYFEMLLFCVSDQNQKVIEEYAFSFSYSDPEVPEVTHVEIRNSSSEFLRRLDFVLSEMVNLPEERTLLMKVLYREDNSRGARYQPRTFTQPSPIGYSGKFNKLIPIQPVRTSYYMLGLEVRSLPELNPLTYEATGECPITQGNWHEYEDYESL